MIKHECCTDSSSYQDWQTRAGQDPISSFPGAPSSRLSDNVELNIHPAVVDSTFFWSAPWLQESQCQQLQEYLTRKSMSCHVLC